MWYRLIFSFFHHRRPSKQTLLPKSDQYDDIRTDVILDGSDDDDSNYTGNIYELYFPIMFYEMK